MARTKKRRRAPVQQTISFPTHGGARPGAGRKPRGLRAGIAHARRPLLSGREPLIVTLKLRPGLLGLRSPQLFARVARALFAARDRFGVRIVHFSVQDDHLHLVLESESREALARAMKGLSVRIARAVNRAMGRTGAVFADRYHVRVLGTPREVASAVFYTVANARKHGTMPPRAVLDPCSSAAAFEEWIDRPPRQDGSIPIVPPRTWLLRVGWRRYGPFCPYVAPGPLR